MLPKPYEVFGTVPEDRLLANVTCPLCDQVVDAALGQGDGPASDARPIRCPRCNVCFVRLTAADDS